MTRVDVPLVVVGTGADGMIAALAACGISVLLEKAAQPADNTRRSTGQTPAAATYSQRAADILDDSTELMGKDILPKNHRQSDPIITRLLRERSAPLVGWWVDEIGCKLICHTDVLYPGMSRFRVHGSPTDYPLELARQLDRAVRVEPQIAPRLNTVAQGLLFDGERVQGIQMDDPDIYADAVVLAVDNFGGNPRLMHQYLAHNVAEALYFGAPENTGKGILWGIQRGVAVEHLNVYQGHASVTAPDSLLVTWALVIKRAIINNRGECLSWVVTGYSEFANQVLAQPGGEAWETFNQEINDASRSTRFKKGIKAGKVYRVESIEALAMPTRLPTARLAETVETVNRVARVRRTIDSAELTSAAVRWRLPSTDQNPRRPLPYARGPHSGHKNLGDVCNFWPPCGSGRGRHDCASRNGLLAAAGLGWIAVNVAAKKEINRSTILRTPRR